MYNGSKRQRNRTVTKEPLHKLQFFMLLKSRCESYRVLRVSGQIVCYLNDRLYVNNNFFFVDFSSQ